MKFVILSMCVACTLQASTVYDTSAALTGTRLVGTGGGLADGGGHDYDHLMLNWSIVQQTSLTYVYTYTISGFSGPNLSNVILDLSDDCAVRSTAGAPLPSCIANVKIDGSTAPLELGRWCFAGPGCQGQSNLGLPQPIIGVKFTSIPAVNSITITFESSRAPVWGDFYLKGGQQYVYNLGNANHMDGNILNFVARPDTFPGDPGSAPEPANLALTAAGLAAVSLLRRRRKKNL